ncbi:MAG: histidine kinase, partial [Psychrosphaera sp.]|nr:histidine kinase [Psychrosphaera sp.]
QLNNQLIESQLQTLKMQINPHFLFNTLNGIVALIFSAPEKAELMVTRLARLLRFSLDSASQNMIPLSEELAVLNDYLVIEKTRIGERLEYQVDVSDDCLLVKIPTLLLQPLVENAVRYGIAPFTHNGTVLVKGRVVAGVVAGVVEMGSEQQLCLEIHDSGEGCASDFEPGIGLCNSRERLETLYQGKASLEIGKSDLGGAKLTILLPIGSLEHT